MSIATNRDNIPECRKCPAECWESKCFERLYRLAQNLTGPQERQPRIAPLYTENMPLANPKSVNVNITTGTGMDIEWDDGHKSHYDFQWLRDACPCATCEEERKNTHRRAGEPAKVAATLLPMYKERPRPKDVQAVGRYALNFRWNDAHDSGIYSWDYLREMCQCEE